MIIVMLVLALGRFLGKFDLEALFTFSFSFCYVDEVLIICTPSCNILDRHQATFAPYVCFLMDIASKLR